MKMKMKVLLIVAFSLIFLSLLWVYALFNVANNEIKELEDHLHSINHFSIIHTLRSGKKGIYIRFTLNPKGSPSQLPYVVVGINGRIVERSYDVDRLTGKHL